MPKGVPVDPQNAHENGCGTNKKYGYGSGIVVSSPAYFLTAIFENDNGGNTGSLVGYTGSFTTMATAPSFTKSTGSGYVLAN
jgi:hypothetical protein